MQKFQDAMNSSFLCEVRTDARIWLDYDEKIDKDPRVEV